MDKENAFSFTDEGKESIQDRIKQLMGNRSMRQTAIAWGLSYSTLNNYFEKGTTPGLKVVKDICQAENVSLEWLVLGKGNQFPQPQTQRSSQQPQQPQQPQQYEAARDKDVQVILAIWQGLEPKEREDLSKLLSRRGGDFLAILLDQHIQELHELMGVRRLLALELKNMPEERVREIYEEYETAGDRLNLTDKQASA
ncbi:helix-turn-helix transcriptional regulator [Salmonella enterica]|nr:helix-turn-helix transcriptional regulator [Salmonella enterica]ECQ2978559.1 helix-turn-helix transcriptional regulator [Salmonella enterica]ECX7129648.1 helix-turn-helix transcriptional regulator [Salmonella enterica]EGT9072401.1 helix-turn-helix transcriptional regulator [Salmonella enterica]EHU4528851.1 helix-turn-helix transcriptional regulator [Salmonella enterica]